jgi:hypothetical protein
MNFKNTDIIVVNLVNHDFPLFRKFLINNHQHFNKIHYVVNGSGHQFNNTESYNYLDVVKRSLPFADIVYAYHEDIDHSKPTDTRCYSTNLALDRSTSESVLFLEPDVIIGNMDYLLNLPDTFDYVAHCEDSTYRLSPSLIWAKRNLIDATSRQFLYGHNFPFIRKLVEPPESSTPIADRIRYFPGPIGADHFDFFTGELLGLSTNAHFINHRSFDFWHMGAVIQTMHLFRCGVYESNGVPIYNYPMMINYLQRTLDCGVELDDRYIKECTAHIQNMNAVLQALA